MHEIPRAVAGVVGDVIGHHVYNHRRLELMFAEAGAPGNPPEGNCVAKTTDWLLRCNKAPIVDPFAVLGAILERFMDEPPGYFDVENVKKGQERIQEVLAKFGLSYMTGGKIIGGSIGVPVRALGDVLKNRDLGALEKEVERALANVVSDPEAGVTAACSMIESLCKIYIHDESLPTPSKETIKDLWRTVAAHLGFDPSAVEDDDVKRVLSGMSSVVDGIGSFRTHAGSAHGRGRGAYRVEPRHARLAIHSAHTLCTFVIETWDKRKSAQNSGITS
jgi:hypothetical protein